MSIVSNILRQSKTLNVLTASTHERYQHGLDKTGHTFFLFQHRSFKEWNSKFAKYPPNHIPLYGEGLGQIPEWLDIDLVLSQNKFGQFQVLGNIAKQLGVPLVSIEHTLPAPWWNQDQLEQLRNMRGDINLFISEYSIKEWGWDSKDDTYVIHHGIDTELFKDRGYTRDNVCLSVVNDWINRDVFCGYNIWRRITDLLPVIVLGATPGLSEPAKSTQALAESYSKSRIFVNTSLISPIPTALLEAMSSGCACVSTATCMIPEIIENGVNGFISNDEKKLREYIELLLNDEVLANELGKNARSTILTKFSNDKFIDSWNNILWKASGKS